MAEIAYDSVSKVYPDGTQAVHDLDLEVEDGELMVLVGPSGCGKTTALRMLAGLEEISDGEIRIGDRIVNDLPPKDRDIAMVFQSYALYPHMTVYDNLAFGLKLRSCRRRDRGARRASREDPRDRGVPQAQAAALSGGQRQRVAMGRAIVREPQAFLMDEPLSNLDAKLRVQMRAEIHQLQRRLGVTTIYVTHDQIEAMTMGDRVAVMKPAPAAGRDAAGLYDNRRNEFVAGFIGSPSINLVEARLEQQDGKLEVTFGDHRLTVDDQVVRNRSGLANFVGKDVILGIRPEDFEDASLDSDAPADRRLRVVCDLTEPLGSEVLVHFATGAERIMSSATAADAGEDADVSFGSDTEDAGASTRLVARVSPRSRIAEGSEIELAVDTTRLYFFDPETGRRSSP